MEATSLLFSDGVLAILMHMCFHGQRCKIYGYKCLYAIVTTSLLFIDHRIWTDLYESLLPHPKGTLSCKNGGSTLVGEQTRLHGMPLPNGVQLWPQVSVPRWWHARAVLPRVSCPSARVLSSTTLQFPWVARSHVDTRKSNRKINYIETICQSQNSTRGGEGL